MFTGHPYGLIVSTTDGAIRSYNAAASQILGALPLDTPETVCDLIGCRRPDGPLEHVCAHEQARDHEGPLPEIRIDLPGAPDARAAWVTVARLDGTDGLVLTELRPGMVDDRRRRTTPHWTAGSRLHVKVLGRTEVLGNEGPLNGRWLSHRAGSVLKFLIAHRHRVVTSDEIVEQVWRDRSASSAKALRHSIHVLRSRLEPDRSANGRGASSFILAEPGGYAVNSAAVTIDADDFERAVTDGLALLADGEEALGRERLRAGTALYGGAFLADEPYTDWALDERDRLHDLAAEALRALVKLDLRDGSQEQAIDGLQRLATLEPFDEDVHAELLRMLIHTGRRSDAVRRYQNLRHLVMSTFDEDLSFRISDLV